MLDDVLLYKDPYGVVLVIGAWNYPVQLTLLPISGAIAAGNCVIIKPSEVSPASAKVIAELVPKYLDQVSKMLITSGRYFFTKIRSEKMTSLLIVSIEGSCRPIREKNH